MTKKSYKRKARSKIEKADRVRRFTECGAALRAQSTHLSSDLNSLIIKACGAWSSVIDASGNFSLANALDAQCKEGDLRRACYALEQQLIQVNNKIVADRTVFNLVLAPRGTSCQKWLAEHDAKMLEDAASIISAMYHHESASAQLLRRMAAEMRIR